MEPKLKADIEARVLDETEDALDDFIRTACNVGLSKGQMAVMLHRKADDLIPPIILPANLTAH